MWVIGAGRLTDAMLAVSPGGDTLIGTVEVDRPGGGSISPSVSARNIRIIWMQIMMERTINTSHCPMDLDVEGRLFRNQSARKLPEHWVSAAISKWAVGAGRLTDAMSAVRPVGDMFSGTVKVDRPGGASTNPYATRPPLEVRTARWTLIRGR